MEIYFTVRKEGIRAVGVGKGNADPPNDILPACT